MMILMDKFQTRRGLSYHRAPSNHHLSRSY